MLQVTRVAGHPCWTTKTIASGLAPRTVLNAQEWNTKPSLHAATLAQSTVFVDEVPAAAAAGSSNSCETLLAAATAARH
eukprot:15619-Chlamydomonas_euryale.AAC.1